jgi:hypothetical protein
VAPYCLTKIIYHDVIHFVNLKLILCDYNCFSLKAYPCHGGGRQAGLDSKGLYVKDPLKSIPTINFKLNYIDFVISIFTIIILKKSFF